MGCFSLLERWEDLPRKDRTAERRQEVVAPRTGGGEIARELVRHLLVFAFLIDLLVGMWVAVNTWQRYQRHGLSQLRDLFGYVVSFNLLVLGYLVAHYAFTNLIGENPMAFPRHVFVMSVGVYVIEIVLSWTALRLG
jgi:hypothetical protein